jgi:hypothetical protein
MDDDSHLVRSAAQEYIARLGRQAIDELNERADISAGINDDETAATWREIARAAATLLNSQ